MKVRHRVYHPPKRETERFRALFIQAYPIRFSLGGFVDCVLGNINKLMSFLRNLRFVRVVSLVGLPSAYFGRPATAKAAGFSVISMLFCLTALFEVRFSINSRFFSLDAFLYSR